MRGSARQGCLFLLSLALGAAAFPDVSGHERVSVERRSPLALGLSADLAPGPAPSACLGLELSYASRLGLGFELPLSAYLGPPRLFCNWSEVLGPWKLGAEAGFSFGLGATTAPADPSLRPAIYPSLSLSLRALRFLDPLAAGLDLRLETCLSRPEAGGTSSSRPFGAELSLFVIEALNDRASLGLSLLQRLEGPRLVGGLPSGEAWAYALCPSLSLCLGGGDFLSSFSLSGPGSGPVFSLGLAYTFRFEGARVEPRPERRRSLVIPRRLSPESRFSAPP